MGLSWAVVSSTEAPVASLAGHHRMYVGEVRKLPVREPHGHEEADAQAHVMIISKHVEETLETRYRHAVKVLAVM